MIDAYQLIDGVLRFAPGTQYVRSQICTSRKDVRKIIVPPGVGFMEDECFADCEELEEVELPEGLVNIGPASFAECPKLCKVNIPSSVKSIDTGSFFSCSSLKKISLPQGVEIISELSFQESGLESITVPSSVKRIETAAFFSCESLRSANVLGASTVIEQDAFGSNYALMEGYIAPGYPTECDRAAELLYTLLWCSCPEQHRAEIGIRAEAFIRKNEGLIMERILKFNNIPALTGIVRRGLLSAEIISASLQSALRDKKTEISALLLQTKNTAVLSDEEFEL